MKRKFYFLLQLFAALTLMFAGSAIAAPTITLTTPTVVAANNNQGTTNVIVYAVKMKVATTAVNVTSICFHFFKRYILSCYNKC